MKEPQDEAGPGLGANTQSAPKNETPTLADIGITYRESARAQFVAQVREDAPEKFEDYKHGKKFLCRSRVC